MGTSELLRDFDWQSIYESQPSEDNVYLVEEFFVPALECSIRYDRIAGYFDSGSLAVAANGIEVLAENDGEMRLIAGTQLQPKDRPVLEALADDLEDSLTELDNDTFDARLQLLAWLLREHRLDIKIAVPSHRDWGIFHPKLGIFHDENDSVLSFEGSINETASGWTRNYERFKVHRSWVDSQQSYVEGDCESFERLWNNEHDYVDVYDFPDALREKLINWKAPDTDVDVEKIVERIRGATEPTTADKAMILTDGAQAPGGLHLAEEACTVEPWPHQRVVSDTAVNTYPNSFLFCDEVGLGKTIETGLTLSRLGLTGELESGLVLAPASLVMQWQEELWEKFNINTYRYERGSNYDYAFIDAFGVEHQAPGTADLEIDIDADRHDEAWTASPIWRFVHQRSDGPWPTIVVMSWHTARLSDRWDQVAPADNGTPRRRSDIPAGCRGRTSDHREGVWDAVVIDEAHNARRGSSFYTLLDRLREHTHCYYLLTATPMQLHHRELYDLLILLDLPDAWDNRSRFVEFFETRQALTSVLDSGADISHRSVSDQASQTTLRETFKDEFDQSVEYTDIVLEGVVSALGLEDEGRGVAKQRLLQACNLACGYGERYDDYRRKIDDAIDERIDPFVADEDTKLKRLLYPESIAEEETLIVSRRDRLNALDELSDDGWQVLQDVFAWATPIDACIHRNTRDTLRKYREVGLLDATVPTRKPERRRIELSDETRRIYDRIDDYTRTFYKRAQQSSESDARAIGFVMTTYRQRLTSSIYAISQSLSSRLDTLHQQRTGLKRQRRNQRGEQQAVLDALTDFDEEEFAELEDAGEDHFDIDLIELAPNLTDEGIDLLEAEIEELESFIQEVKQIDTDPKVGQLFDDLRMLSNEGRNRIIVFTQYTDTMHFVRDRLRWKFGENIACYSGDGGEMYDEDADTWRNVGKERVKREFADSDGDIDVLVCTDSASEGLNLQECGALINYDLPWNPMRVEQRIGRIDRIGQKYDEVIILNYSYEDTVESDIYDRLDDRIGLFEYVVGDMQPILSSVGQQIRAATLEEGAKSGTEEYERLQADIESDIDEQEAEDDPIELRESLADVDNGTPLREQVIEEARLDAWETYSHPDLGAVGDGSAAHDPAFSVAAVEAVFVDSSGFDETGIEFTQLDTLEEEFDLIDPNHSEAIYRVSLPHDDDNWTTPDEGTLGAAIAGDDNTAVVTFSPECADAYPSLHFLAPGSPLFAWLIEQLFETSDELTLTRKAYGYTADGNHDCREREHRPWAVCGWTSRDTVVRMLSTDGTLTTSDEGSVVDELNTWCAAFAQLRDLASV